MTREEFSTRCTDVLNNLENRGEVSTILDELRTAYYEVVEHGETVEAERDDLRARNDNLQQANMDLFLKVGKVATGEPDPEPTPEPEEEKMSFDDLYDERGELIK